VSRITEIENTLRQHGEIITKLYEELHKAQAKNAELVARITKEA
jgi:hypothetical protein